MCDTANSLPYAGPFYSGGTLRHCSACGSWHTGDCFGGAMWPSTGGTVSAWSCAKCGGQVFSGSVHHCQTAVRFVPVSTVNVNDVQRALDKLADELAALTKEMPQEQQQGVWDAFWALQKELKP